MFENIVAFIQGLTLDAVVKFAIAVILIVLGFKVVNKILKLLLKILGVVLLVVIILKTLGWV